MPTPPPWGWKEAEKPEIRFTMRNEVRVARLRDDGEYDSHVETRYADTPMEFFQFCREVLCIADLSPYSFYLDEVEKGKYVFGLAQYGGGDTPYPLDLWCWTRASVPPFLTRR